MTVTTPEYRHSPRTPRECRVICHGRSPDLRVVACVGPSRFPSGMYRTRSPLTVAGAVVGFHHVPFSPGLARTMTCWAYNRAGRIASFADRWAIMGRVLGWYGAEMGIGGIVHGKRWDGLPSSRTTTRINRLIRVGIWEKPPVSWLRDIAEFRCSWFVCFACGKLWATFLRVVSVYILCLFSRLVAYFAQIRSLIHKMQF